MVWLERKNMAASDPLGVKYCGYRLVCQDEAKKYGSVPAIAEGLESESTYQVTLHLTLQRFHPSISQGDDAIARVRIRLPIQ